MPRPIQVEIDTSALQHNLQQVRKCSHSKIMAVLKANAYGHGLLPAATALEQADAYALLDIKDAVTLREQGIDKPIVLLEGFFSPSDLPLIFAYNLSCVIHSAWQVELLNLAPSRKKIDIWLKINTGMNRLGFTLQQAPAVIEHLRHHPAVNQLGLLTHFANADTPHGIDTPLNNFKRLCSNYRLPCSSANSAALLSTSDSHFDWIRPGLMLYGASPFAHISAKELGLHPCMTLQSKIIATQQLQAGEYVGYGNQFQASSPTKIGIVACGYADGYPRHAATGTPILVNGIKTATLGRVSMDMLAVNLSTIPDANIGSNVELWGKNLAIDEVATSANTISYELMCAITTRVAINIK